VVSKLENNIANQRILILSDTHLTRHFDKRKFKFLIDTISDSDWVIINGDFWDSWFTNFDGFVQSEWKRLFPYLLEKKAIYIFGNHDLKEKTDNRVGLFSVKSVDSFDIKTKTKTYHIEHGRRILELENDRFLIMYSRVMQTFEKIHFSLVFYFLNLFEIIGYSIFGKNIARRSKFAKNRNLLLKNSKRKDWLLCGDTHCPEIDMIKKFANSGCILHGHASYLIVDRGEVSLHITKYD